jgi:hypothetical protein
LVAFVAAPKQETQLAVLAPTAETAGVNRGIEVTDGVFHSPTQLSAQLRAIDTKAIVPASRSAAIAPAAQPDRSAESPAGATEEANSEAAAPRAIFVKAADPALPSDATDAPPSQELVVLTAWEEVETSSSRTRTVADYETGASEQQQTGSATGQPDTSQSNTSQTNSDRGVQITVTRMIFLVCPASSATSSKAAPTTSFHFHRLAASQFDGGWLVFQL